MACISIITGCYNEEENVRDLYQRVCDVFANLNKHWSKLIFADNSSKDNTVAILKEIARETSGSRSSTTTGISALFARVTMLPAS